MHLHDLLDTLFTRLVWTSAQAVLLIALVAALIRLAPRLSAALRCMLWWLVGAQLLIGLCWPAPLSLRLLPAAAPTATTTMTPSTPDLSLAADAAATSANTYAPRPVDTTAANATATPPSHPLPISTPTALLALWLAGLLLQSAWAIRHGRRSRRLLATSTPCRDTALEAQCRAQAQRLGLRRAPALRMSCDIDSPHVTGLRRPVILLPADAGFSPAEAAMAVAHELAHLRRGDLWLGWIPALAQRLFFFHPLATRAMREYALCREAACDALVLQQAGVAAGAYGQLLLRMGVSAPMHPGLAGASPTFRILKRRLTMLQQPSDTPRGVTFWLPVLLVALAGVLPWRVTARPTTDTPAASHTQARPSAATKPSAYVHATAHADAHAVSGRHIHIDTDTHDHARDGFALIDRDSMIVQGAGVDLDHARSLHDSHDSALWVRRGGKAWVIHDPATLKAARDAYAPVVALSREQGRLAGKQGELAGRQAGLASQQAAAASHRADLAGHQADLAARRAARVAREAARRSSEQAELQARRAALDAERASLQASPATADASMAEHARRIAELDAQRKALDTEQVARDKAARQADQKAMQAERAELQRERAHMQKSDAPSQARIQARQHELAEQQKDLGTQQRALSERQKAATAEAQQRVQKLLDQAIARGIAKPVQMD
ncbi:M56 family metallopeptidase [Oleiagrimonas soli]|uniref:Beta-lactamase regulating signal transducer with metallopeptidase domain n=1 Tax=Oleiagrimonas soli TaxID=1543381 RepID=A0A841KRN9_9GAMM|nr:M56 family metallopeptidase [Oleiagrimonas soli]MBB6184614.1 beta-lactamase regulating signal transducer with metallopeptidase domain [Oleiagrimonas soli]